jgi:hypothetical protein
VDLRERTAATAALASGRTVGPERREQLELLEAAQEFGREAGLTHEIRRDDANTRASATQIRSPEANIVPLAGSPEANNLNSRGCNPRSRGGM